MAVSYIGNMSKHESASTYLIAQIILQSRKLRRIKQEVLGPAVGCSRSYISKLEKGGVLPSIDLATNLEKALNLSPDSLVKLVRDIKLKEAALRAQNRQNLQATRKGKVSFLLSENVLIPLYVTAAGIWNDQIHRYIAIPKNEISSGKYFFFKVPDDAMDKAGIRKGDLMLVENRKAKSGEICVFCVLKKCFVRHCEKTRHGVSMIAHSTNSEYKSLRFPSMSVIDLKGVIKGQYLARGGLNGQWSRVPHK
jgi:SOS-response transcriptional repressor LexA